MFCPKCATKNLDGAHFCRTCGANISLVPQALTGQLPEPATTEGLSFEGRRGQGKRRGEPSLDQSFKNIFTGIAFLIIAIALSRSIGGGWWFWMLIPAFSMMGKGVAQYVRLKEKQNNPGSAALPVSRAPAAFPTRVSGAPVSAPQRNTGELLPTPISVTEGTTRHLGADAPTRHLDEAGNQK